MKKRIISFLMIVVLLAGVLSFSAAAAGSLSNFTQVNTYDGQFTDVPASQWYADEVQLVYEYGLINGKTATTFEPDSYLTIAEAIKLAAVLHSIYYNGTAAFENGDPWYSTYVDYALENGIISSAYANYNAFATRADFALILASALPEEALTAINNISSNAIPDVTVSDSYGSAVYLLYRAGILTGSGDDHAFYPSDNIKRSEVSAVIARMANERFRQSVTLALEELSTTEVATLCTPAVFLIELYNSFGDLIGTGSGFFIDSSGLAVTNYHVIDGVYSAVIVMPDNTRYDVAGVYDYNEATDLALIQIDGSGFPYLEIGDSTSLLTGSDIYAIGYPGGIAQTFTPGIITNKSYLLDDISYILIDAAISSGSSGGALVNTYGEVIGVTSATYTSAQNLNLAVPIHLIQALSQDSYTELSTAVPQPEYQITANPKSLSLTVGNQSSVTITDPSGNEDYSVYYFIDDDSIVSCTWGNWLDMKRCRLYIEGLSVGTTTVHVALYDENVDFISVTSIDVTVS